ncbi:MAG: hypothetical protein RLZZ399_721 [Verrucomicrobiota bacterium]|jgi:hypothetical protein
MRPKNILFLVALTVLGLLAWYALRPIPLNETPASFTAVATQAPEPLPSAPTPEPPTPQPLPEDKAPLPQSGALPTWELKIDEALRSQADHGAIAKQLLLQIPSMPPEGQQAAAQHIVNLMPDTDYLSVIPYVQNLNISKGFQETIVAESLNRPKEVKLPVLLAAARLPRHPMQDTALSVLSVLVGQNYGSDWAKWEAAVKTALQQP